MERITLPTDVSSDEVVFYNTLLDTTLGNPIILDSTPTTANGLLKENNLGFDGSNLFITLQGTTFKLSLTAV